MNSKIFEKKHTAISKILAKGKIIETSFDPKKQQTSFVVYKKTGIQHTNKINFGENLLIPINQLNPLLTNNIVRFPSQSIDYGSTKRLIKELHYFIHKYIDLSIEFEIITTYYVLLSWVYDRFDEIPYLRKIGDLGSGKTRFLKVLGSICYKSTFASGGTSTAALFHIIDKFKGTLILDEADFVFSDEKSAIAKILNNGNVKGFPILRVSQSSNGQFSPISYDVFCPKIIASRGGFSDDALESRFITENFRPIKIRKDIPTTLPESFEKEALKLRNKLLYYRFKNLFKIKKYEIPDSYNLEGRIKQIFSPLLSVVSDPEDRKRILSTASKYNDDLINSRKQTIEIQVLSIVKNLIDNKMALSIKNITNEFVDEYSDFYSKKITTKWIGFIIRKKLNLSTYKSDGNYIIDPNCHTLLNQLFERYDV